jgi:hypothetical protein
MPNRVCSVRIAVARIYKDQGAKKADAKLPEQIKREPSIPDKKPKPA